MVITPKDVDGLRRLLTRVQDGTKGDPLHELASLFGSRLYPALTCGFDEIRLEPIGNVMQSELEFYREQTDTPQLEWHHTAKGDFESPFLRQAFRSITGTWYGFPHVSYQRDGSFGLALFPLRMNTAGDVRILTIEDLLSGCEASLTSQQATGAIVLPNLWKPPQVYPSLEVVEATKVLLTTLQSGHTTLAEVSWKELEAIVAELLRARGMEVSITPYSRDGGRDILARGELIPGEPTVLAVEVKHKGLVGIDDVASRLYRNKEFPALLFATSGRFSAGVLREKERPENFLRLILKDGTALSQWITEYHRE
jgi:hypothetical protein